MSTRSKPNKKKKMTLAEENKLLKKLGLPPRKRITIATIKKEFKDKARALPKEERQRILDMIWEGHTYGSIVKLCEVDLETVIGLEELNTEYIPMLRKETV